MNSVSKLFLCFACIGALAFAGCGSGDPALGTVTGTVTMDGKPISDVMVTFYPSSGGIQSAGITDSNGKYELTYDGRKKGAVIGQHQVRLSSAAGGGDAGGDDAVKPIVIPAKYAGDSTLSTSVSEGENSFDIDMKSR